jgi:CRISPR-associated endonuclease/helicase Cas3
MSLTIGDFPEFFASANAGHEPFPWQTRFLAEVWDRLEDDESTGPYFPELVDLPTGAGKTSIIDIAVFLLAIEAQRPLDRRRIPRRIVFVVDRRVVVDQAHEHALELARVLATVSSDSVVGHVATALGSYSQGGRGEPAPPPLLSTVLRGGIVRDETWAKRPDVPAVISSTVDQVGSRLLFRGYGLSASMQPIHAGLLGSDTLFLLDEVHLSAPFAQTLRALAEDYQANWAAVAVPARWEVVELSATPGSQTTGAAFRLDEAHGDLDRGLSEILPRRLRASKPVELVNPVKITGSDRVRAVDSFAAVCADQAERLLARQGVSTVAVVVNRVETAVATHRALVERDWDCVLLTGRMRPYDREVLMRTRVRARLRTGRPREETDRPLIVVATQCIEAGADFDFDGLVTEVASLDALIQRFGRVDRDGRLSDAGTPAHSAIVVKSSDLKGDPDPVYGAALAKAWDALCDTVDLDFGINALPQALRADPNLQVPPLNAPILFPGHLDSWVQTNPKPTPDPDPKFWLHGPDNSTNDVSIVWRSDLNEGLLGDALGEVTDGNEEGVHLAAVRTLVVAAPPGAMEATSVPLSAARKWLSGQDVPPISDVEAGSPEVEDDRRGAQPRPFVRWAGDHSEVLLLSGGRPRRLRPGDVLLVPATYGGVGAHGSWDPTSMVAVRDLSERTQLIQRRRALLRLVPGVLRGTEDQPLDIALPHPDQDPDSTDRGAVMDWLDNHLDELGTDQRIAARQISAALIRGGRRGRQVAIEPVRVTNAGVVQRHLIVTGPLVDPFDVVMRELDEASLGGDLADCVDSEPDTSSFTSVEVTLDDHLEGVGAWAKLLATNCGLSPELRADLELAGRLHDLGKADPRFQVWLNNGDPVAASRQPLAKSSTAADAFALRQAARERSGYPPGCRHELMSLAMIDGVDAVNAKAADWDLVRHLVASHHGWCRPFPPAVLEANSFVVRHTFDGEQFEGDSLHRLEQLDSGVADRFWLLVRRYGWHRLAWFEAILRLADHRRSEWEQVHAAQDAEYEQRPVEDSDPSLVRVGAAPEGNAP